MMILNGVKAYLSEKKEVGTARGRKGSNPTFRKKKWDWRGLGLRLSLRTSNADVTLTKALRIKYGCVSTKSTLCT